MLSNKIRTSRTTLVRRLSALAAVGVVATSLAAAGPANAQPVKGTGAKGCPVEDANGTVTYVPEGTRVGLFRCGSDGEWHFGWLANAQTASPTSGGKQVAVAPAARTTRAVQ